MHVPFGNSSFQEAHFTPGREGVLRRRRSILLNLNKRLDALQEAKFSRDRQQVTIDEANSKIARLDPVEDVYEIRRLEIDRDEARYRLAGQEKYIADAMIDCETMYAELGTLPECTRLEFEQAERGYWEKRLTSDAIRELNATGRIEIGTSKALDDIGVRAQVEGGIVKFLGVQVLKAIEAK